MRALLLAAGLAVVAGCSLVQLSPEPVWALLIVNTSNEGREPGDLHVGAQMAAKA